MKETKWKNFRNRVMLFLFYPEDITHMNAFEYIKNNYDYASILHDKDVTEDGEIKKEHYHVAVRFEGDARWASAVCKELGIKENYCQEIRGLDRTLQYLIHYNDSDKAQYDIELVQGPLKTKLIESINKIGKGESEKVVELIQFIEESNKPISVTEFASFCAKNGYWAEFRRSGSIFCKMLEEHNYYVSNKKNEKS